MYLIFRVLINYTNFLLNLKKKNGFTSFSQRQ